MISEKLVEPRYPNSSAVAFLSPTVLIVLGAAGDTVVGGSGANVDACLQEVRGATDGEPGSAADGDEVKARLPEVRGVTDRSSLSPAFVSGAG